MDAKVLFLALNHLAGLEKKMLGVFTLEVIRG